MTKKGKAKPSLGEWIEKELQKIDDGAKGRTFLYPAEFGRKYALKDVQRELKKRGRPR